MDEIDPNISNGSRVLGPHSLLALASFLIIIQIGLMNSATIAERSSIAVSWLVRRPELLQSHAKHCLGGGIDPLWKRSRRQQLRLRPLRTVHGWAVENQNVLVMANSGLLCTEISTEGDEICRTWIEYPRRMLRSTALSEVELRGCLPEDKRRSKIEVIVRSMGR
ncbi:hypothetical protein HD806DRAFT_521538 [Xylariaceae sp. AK1471]|nr:hypothetical protein HD806DRAFT_521538 [Xylariaceae sp. AK1471]